MLLWLEVFMLNYWDNKCNIVGIDDPLPCYNLLTMQWNIGKHFITGTGYLYQIFKR